MYFSIIIIYGKLPKTSEYKVLLLLKKKILMFCWLFKIPLRYAVVLHNLLIELILTNFF